MGIQRLLGDATPPSGEGSNLDAMDLTFTIVKSGGISAFKKMFKRVTEETESGLNLEIMIAPDAQKSFVDRMAFLVSQGGPPGGPPEGH